MPLDLPPSGPKDTPPAQVYRITDPHQLQLTDIASMPGAIWQGARPADTQPEEEQRAPRSRGELLNRLSDLIRADGVSVEKALGLLRVASKEDLSWLETNGEPHLRRLHAAWQGGKLSPKYYCELRGYFIERVLTGAEIASLDSLGDRLDEQLKKHPIDAKSVLKVLRQVEPRNRSQITEGQTFWIKRLDLALQGNDLGYFDYLNICRYLEGFDARMEALNISRDPKHAVEALGEMRPGDRLLVASEFQALGGAVSSPSLLEVITQGIKEEKSGPGLIEEYRRAAELIYGPKVMASASSWLEAGRLSETGKPGASLCAMTAALTESDVSRDPPWRNDQNALVLAIQDVFRCAEWLEGFGVKVDDASFLNNQRALAIGSVATVKYAQDKIVGSVLSNNISALGAAGKENN